VDETDENTIVIENQPDLKFTSAPIVPIASDKWIILDDNGKMVLGNTTGGSKWKILKPTKETNEQFYKRDGLDNEVSAKNICKILQSVIVIVIPSFLENRLLRILWVERTRNSPGHPKRMLLLGKIFWPQAGFEQALRGA
jgi:hypothetical protein